MPIHSTASSSFSPYVARSRAYTPPMMKKAMRHWVGVAPGFKDKTRYVPYVCPEIQFTHIVTNEGVISKTMPLLHRTQIFVTKDTVLVYSIYYNSILLA